MDYYVGSDGMDNDEVEQGFTKWFIDLVKYLSKSKLSILFYFTLFYFILFYFKLRSKISTRDELKAKFNVKRDYSDYKY